MQCRCDVLVASNAGDQSRSSMRDRLQSSGDTIGDTVQKRVAVVNAACDERMDKSVHCSASSVSDLMIRTDDAERSSCAAHYTIDMVSHGELRVKRHAQCHLETQCMDPPTDSGRG